MRQIFVLQLTTQHAKNLVHVIWAKGRTNRRRVGFLLMYSYYLLELNSSHKSGERDRCPSSPNDPTQGRSQHGARGNFPPPPPDFTVAPFKMGSAITASRLLLCQSHSPVTLCKSLVWIVVDLFFQACMVCEVVDLFYCKIYLRTSSGVACEGKARAPLPSQSPK